MQMRQRAERLLLRGRLDREACSRVRDTAFRGSRGKGKKGEYGLRGLAIDRWNRVRDRVYSIRGRLSGILQNTLLNGYIIT